ncbi:hypothetical protein J5N97_013049 [Dioscorea zingiberensis]|uniref:Uncharacterized protein n=1 Tax=Dioscorea zingiberensis TaxID=325984 RepID=A0A9D5CSM4_9LILI|nr:hypothetical protein J5N97_013049 [Dioscorea zingiberensis]
MANTNSWVLQTKSFFLSPCFRRPASTSKDESLYHQVKCGNIAEIRKLHRDGAGLEWVDKKGQTPLILACKRSALFPVAKVLIELGANVNAYRPGPHGGTPLHHAATHGLRETVILLLSHGAYPLLMNGDRRTALGLARRKGYSAVVRSIEFSLPRRTRRLRRLDVSSGLQPIQFGGCVPSPSFGEIQS